MIYCFYHILPSRIRHELQNKINQIKVKFRVKRLISNHFFIEAKATDITLNKLLYERVDDIINFTCTEVKPVHVSTSNKV